jgi:hypothetical protein
MISHSWYSFGGAKRRSGLCKQARSPQQLDNTEHILISVPVDAHPFERRSKIRTERSTESYGGWNNGYSMVNGALTAVFLEFGHPDERNFLT